MPKDALGHGSNPQGSTLAGDHLPVWWHGSAMGFPAKTGQVHVGTYAAARIALEARIGIPADGKGWTGNREYGKTLLAGGDTLNRLALPGKYFNRYPQTGFNSDAPKKDYYAKDRRLERATFMDKTPVPYDAKPAVRPYQIVGVMKNTPSFPYKDAVANRLAKAQDTTGNGKHGFYYRNESEDDGSISAVVPSRGHLTGLME